MELSVKKNNHASYFCHVAVVWASPDFKFWLLALSLTVVLHINVLIDTHFTFTWHYMFQLITNTLTCQVALWFFMRLHCWPPVLCFVLLLLLLKRLAWYDPLLLINTASVCLKRIAIAIFNVHSNYLLHSSRISRCRCTPGGLQGLGLAMAVRKIPCRKKKHSCQAMLSSGSVSNAVSDSQLCIVHYLWPCSNFAPCRLALWIVHIILKSVMQSAPVQMHVLIKEDACHEMWVSTYIQCVYFEFQWFGCYSFMGQTYCSELGRFE